MESCFWVVCTCSVITYCCVHVVCASTLLRAFCPRCLKCLRPWCKWNSLCGLFSSSLGTCSPNFYLWDAMLSTLCPLGCCCQSLARYPPYGENLGPFCIVGIDVQVGVKVHYLVCMAILYPGNWWRSGYSAQFKIGRLLVSGRVKKKINSKSLPIIN